MLEPYIENISLFLNPQGSFKNFMLMFEAEILSIFKGGDSLKSQQLTDFSYLDQNKMVRKF